MKPQALFRFGKLVAINLLIFVLLLLILEIVFRLLGWGYNSGPTNQDPTYGFVHPPNYLYKMYSPSGEYGNYMVYYDSLGRRSQLPSLMKSSQKKRSIIFLGDSFTEALQVPFDSSFIGRLAHQYPSTEFFNYGVGGYSPVLFYLQCKNILQHHKIVPSLVIMVLYSNDVREDSTYITKAVFRKSDNELIAINGGKKNSLIAYLRKLYIAKMLKRIFVQKNFEKKKSLTRLQGRMVNRLLEENPDLNNTLSGSYILKTDSLLKKYNIPFYITAIPSRYKNFTKNTSETLYAEKVSAWATQHKISFIDINLSFNKAYTLNDTKYFFDIDMHFNLAGQRLMSVILEQQLQKYFIQ